MDDAVLLGRFAETGCQESFQEIVTRHSGWIFSLSLRAVRDRHLAEDVTQAVFIILARKASSIREGTPLSGWLFKAARFAVSDALKRRTRMKNRENRFAEFFRIAHGDDGATANGPDTSEISDELSHTLDEAVACLSESDRQAVLLRFYEGKSLAEIGTILGISEEAAKKRVSRTVDKLRKHFANRGVITGAAFLLLLLGRRTAEAATFTPTVVTPYAAPAATQAIATGALKLMATAQAKLLSAIFAGGLTVMVGVPILGGAISNLNAAPAAVATKPLPPATYHLEETPAPRLPNDSRVADLWIGYKGDILWRSDEYTHKPTAAMPFQLKAAADKDVPYAVAIDSYGNFFLRPLDMGILQSPMIRQAQFDYDAGPVANDRRVSQMMSLIEPPASDIDILPTHGVGVARSTSFSAPSGRPEKVSDNDWQQLQRLQENEDGTVIVEQLAPKSLMLPAGTLDDAFRSNPFDYIVEAPEPTTGLLTLAATALLSLRPRRRRS